MVDKVTAYVSIGTRVDGNQSPVSYAALILIPVVLVVTWITLIVENIFETFDILKYISPQQMSPHGGSTSEVSSERDSLILPKAINVRSVLVRIQERWMMEDGGVSAQDLVQAGESSVG